MATKLVDAILTLGQNIITAAEILADAKVKAHAMSEETIRKISNDMDRRAARDDDSRH